MASRLVEFFKQSQPQTSAQAQALADALSQQSSAPRGTFAGYQGRVMPSFSWGEGLAQLGEAFMARKAQKKANELTEAERKMLAEQLRGMTQQPGASPDPRRDAAVAALSGLPPQVQQGVLGQAAAQQLFPDPTQSQDPTKVQEYERAKRDGYQGTFEQFLNQFYGREQNTPSTLQEWDAYKAMTPEEQARYIEMKRALPLPTVNQVPTQVLPGGQQRPLSTLDDTAASAATVAEATAQGAAAGQNTGAIEAKEPALDSFNYVVDQFYGALRKTPTGGTLGVRGRLGGLLDYQDARAFDNLKEQLSTELRTLFRIPGEGTLSDREQAQYGLQLPDRLNDPGVNEQILRSLQDRASLRMRLPIGGQPAQPEQSGGPRKEVLWNELEVP